MQLSAYWRVALIGLVFSLMPMVAAQNVGEQHEQGTYVFPPGGGGADIYASGSDGDSSTTSNDSFLELIGGEITLIRGCANNEIPKWNETTDKWECKADGGGAETNSLEVITTGIADTEIPIGTAADTVVYSALSGDVTMANTGAVTVVDDSHAHVVSNIDANTSAAWAGQVSDETGSGLWVFGTAPVFVTSITVGNGTTSAGILQIDEDDDDGSNNLTFTVPALAADTDYIWPANDGDADQQLTTNGTGTLSWAVAGSQTDIGVRVTDAGAQTITTSTLTDVNFDTERWDNDTMHDTSTNNERLVATTAGTYQITCHIRWGVNTTGERLIRIELNDTTIIGSVRDETNTGASDTLVQSVGTTYQMAATDYVKCIIFQDSGGDVATVKSNNYSPEFMMQRISP